MAGAFISITNNANLGNPKWHFKFFFDLFYYDYFGTLKEYLSFSDTITLKTVECLTPTLMTHTKIQMTEGHIQIVI